MTQGSQITLKKFFSLLAYPAFQIAIRSWAKKGPKRELAILRIPEAMLN